MQTLGAKPHLSHHEGFRLFLFFVHNGISPNMARDWLILRHTYDRNHNGKEADILVERYNNGLLQNYSSTDIESVREKNFYDPGKIKSLDKEYLDEVNWTFINRHDAEKQIELYSIKDQLGDYMFATRYNHLYDEDEAWIYKDYKYSI